MKQELLPFATRKQPISIPLTGDADSLFEQGVLIEADDATGALALYLRAINIDPGHVFSHINAGTIYYNRQQFKQALQHYRKAVASNPNYPKAHFNLANTLDDIGQRREAIDSYYVAIALQHDFADAHFNLALALEQTGERRQALMHWKAYRKLNPSCQQARIATENILSRDCLQIVVSTSKPRRTAKRAALLLVKR